MEKIFGKLDESQNLEIARKIFKHNGILYSYPSELTYRDAGYKEIINEIPIPKDGYNIVFTKYSQDDNNIYYNYEYIENSNDKKEEHFEQTFEISKLSLRIALCKLGIWEKVEHWLRSFDIDLGDGMLINAYDAWSEALVIDTASELFKPYLSLAKEAFKDYVTSEQVDEILLNCKAK